MNGERGGRFGRCIVTEFTNVYCRHPKGLSSTANNKYRFVRFLHDAYASKRRTSRRGKTVWYTFVGDVFLFIPSFYRARRPERSARNSSYDKRPAPVDRRSVRLENAMCAYNPKRTRPKSHPDLYAIYCCLHYFRPPPSSDT